MTLTDIPVLLYYFTFASLLVVAFVYDLKHKLLPDFVSYGIILLFLVRFLFAVSFRVWGFGIWNLFVNWKLEIGNYFYDILASVAILALFGGIWFFSKGTAMGFGDVKLAPAIALFLGFQKGVLAVLFSFWIGAVVGIFLIMITRFSNIPKSDFGNGGRRFSLKSEIPFGPFLALGGMISLLWGNELLTWYFNLI
ncbi:MAG: hypothetical protein A2934_03400 [Candidatus Sungbacteria bacterium RIFCSPLOWO2_01_FULL_47_10]|uniref:Prepilin type IV endopeptidase peptidase domain-containing protein n=1 Tax=Candidatus Sungbacteria bacterium RIFCSPLOWO2_01_FULL_47_10 TaxID=1802276 RepID=A0A1G2L6B1_9BACT|nr:MAG: hypothetical protein A2934_03400 [Candidatus Sungbacteria bacterium RIFCSPLOWO2_01_FULL_47_10]